MSDDVTVAYARRLYDDVRGWYSNADTKAQVVLAMDAAFVAFVTSAIFGKAPSELKAILGLSYWWTWLWLALMTICLLGSMMNAILCLWSRIYSAEQLRLFVDDAQRTSGTSERYSPKVMWFFQMVSELDKDLFLSTLASVDKRFETEVLASQIRILATNVRNKHRAVNRGFVLAAATLVFFFFAGLSYVARNV